MDELSYRESTESLTGLKHFGQFWTRTLDQDRVWIDAQLREHAIARMPQDYIENVIDFCRADALSFQRMMIEEIETQGIYGRRLELIEEEDAEIWLESTPLLLALRARLHALRLLAAIAAGQSPLRRAAQPVSDNQPAGAQDLSL